MAARRADRPVEAPPQLQAVLSLLQPVEMVEVPFEFLQASPDLLD
jgi:hypothetical protein